MKAACTDAEFMELFQKLGAAETAKRLGIGERRVFARRRTLERRRQIQINAPNHAANRIPPKAQVTKKVWDGVVIQGSDAHYWPGQASAAHRALVKFCKDLKPKGVVMNGDLLDGSMISRHPRIGWDSRPTVIQELEVTKDRLGEITTAAEGAWRAWPLGNHDSRYETRLANTAPEYAHVPGMSLHDHFSDWEPCWMVWINEDVSIRHRWKGGVHATHNNTLGSGVNMGTGHDHMLKITPFSDYRGARYGFSSGTLAPLYAPQFIDYTEASPENWQSGFLVLTFSEGKLLRPEAVDVVDEERGLVSFRGKIYQV